VPNLIALCLFLGFVTLGILAASRSASSVDGTPSLFVQLFIVYTVVVSCAAGFLHSENWPFSRWNIFPLKAPDVVYAVRVRAVDASGVEYDIDHRAWEPFSTMELYTWLDFDFPNMDDRRRRRAATYLLEKTNAARMRALTGQPIGTFDRWFGVFTAPMHVLYRDLWTTPGQTPGNPFVGLRIYREWWNVQDRALDPKRVWRVSIYDFPGL
jgi:hypothetical protein